MANVPAGGDLMVARYKDGVTQGDDKGFGSFAPASVMEFGGTASGHDLSGDATNRMGSCDGTMSDPMFAKFKHEDDQPNKGTGSESPDSVSSQRMAGAGSDPQDEDLPYEQQGGPGAAPAENAQDKDD